MNERIVPFIFRLPALSKNYWVFLATGVNYLNSFLRTVAPIVKNNQLTFFNKYIFYAFFSRIIRHILKKQFNLRNIMSHNIKLKRTIPMAVLLISAALISCSKQVSSKPSDGSVPLPRHAGMCKKINLGEASDLIEQSKIPDNQYCTIQGLSNPKLLMWQDTQTSKIYFATKLMGAQGRLFYMQ
jgi:hypothetical protein